MFRRFLSRTAIVAERKKFIIRESVRPHAEESKKMSDKDEISEILGLDQSIDFAGREILSQFYKTPEIEKDISTRFNRRVYDDEAMPSIQPWKALETVEAESEISNVEIPVVESTQLQKIALEVKRLLESHSPVEALNYLNTIAASDPESLHPHLYGLVACYHSSAGNATLAITLLEDMMALLKILPDESTYNAIIQDLCISYDYQKAQDLVSHMEQHTLTPSQESYEHLVDACAASENDVRTLLDTYQSKHVPITIRMANTFLLTLEMSSDYSSAISMFRNLKRTYFVDPNEITLETMLKIFIKCNKVADSVNVLQQLIDIDSPLAQQYALKVFDVCVHGRKYSDAVRILSQMQKNASTKATIKELIKSYASEWENALKHLLTQNEATLKSQIAEKYDFDSNTTPVIPPTIEEQESTKSLALHLYKQLLSYNIIISPPTVSLLIRLYHRNQDLISAVRCWSIHHSNTTPNQRVIQSLLAAIRDLGQERTAKVVVDLRVNESWVIDRTMCGHLFVIMSRYGLARDLQRLVIDIKAALDSPDPNNSEGKVAFGIEEYAICTSTMTSFAKLDALKAFKGFCEEFYPSIVEEYEDRVDRIRLKGVSKH